MALLGDVAVSLRIVDDGGRRVETASEGMGIGELRLRPSQIHAVPTAAGEFHGSSAYLIKVNYELRLLPELAPMRWYELGLHLTDDTSATFMDAIPRTSRTAQAPSAHDVNDYLQLVPAAPTGPGRVHLPFVDGRVILHDIPGSSVRWLHFAEDADGVHPGAHSAWVVLLAPEERRHQAVTLSVRYDLRNDDDSPYRPVQEPTGFVITLREADREPSIAPVARRRRTDQAVDLLSAFVCYAHDTPEHKANVRKFAQLLMHEGIDVHIDQYDVGPRKDWGHWAVEQFSKWDFVLVMASPMCAAVGNGAGVERHPGLRAEFEILRSLYQSYAEWAQYVLPVVLPEQSKEGVPLFLAPETKDYYPVVDYTSAGVEYLLNAMNKTGPRTWPLDYPGSPDTR